MTTNRSLIALAAAALALAVGPASALAGGGFAVSSPPKSFQVGTGAFPDVAVDAAGTGHVVWNEDSGSASTPDPLHYCQVPRGATACSSEQVLSPPLEGIGRTTYVFAPGGGRVLIETYRCCTSDPGVTGNYVYESTDGGQTFGPAHRIGNIDHQSDAIFGPGETISGASIATFQRMPLTGAPASTFAEFDAGFPVPTHSDIGLVDGAPLQVMSDGDNTSFVRNNGSDPNSSGNWSSATPITPPGGEPRVASGPAGLVLLYRTGEPGSRNLSARKFDGTGFGAPVTVSEPGDPEFFDLWAEPTTGEFHALWIANDESPNELRWSRSKDGVTWTAPQIVIAGEEADSVFHTQVSTAPDEQGFGVWDANGANTPIRMVPLKPGSGGGGGGGAATTPQSSTTVGGQQITLLGPGGCVNAGTPVFLRVTSKTKKKLSPKKRVKIVKVVFSLDKKKKTDKKAAFKAKFSTKGFATGSTHKLKAVIPLKPVVGKGKKKTKTLKGKLKICGG